ncbi:hypothetical protein L6452_30326 [Arctium lappa]|uniref:Uncharacterized protein n=1 Tax=Arctium lappa TaxID=4217 RepID=A0ACB8ZJ32_ARCLA|nr:hypothetical protein L6452_30326 [Arctium lappa]
MLRINLRTESTSRMRAEDGRRRSSLVGQGQQHRGENSGCVERKEEERKPNKSYLEAVKYGPNKREYSAAGDQPEGGRKVDQIFDQKSVLSEWSSEENNNDFLKMCVMGRVSRGDKEVVRGYMSRFGEDEGRSVNGGKSVEHINGEGVEGSTGDPGGAPATVKKVEQSAGEIDGLVSQRKACGYEFHEEAMELNEEERILNGKSEIEKNMVGQVNKEYMMESQAHSEKGGESNSGLFGEVIRVQQVGPVGNLESIQHAGTEKEGIEVDKENSTNSVAGKDKSGLEEMGNSK